MNWNKGSFRLKIGSKLTLSYLFVAGLVIAIGWLGLDANHRVGRNFTHVLEVTSQEVLALNNISANAFRLQMEILSTANLHLSEDFDAEEVKNERDEFDSAVVLLDYWIDYFRKLETANAPDADSLRALRNQYWSVGSKLFPDKNIQTQLDEAYVEDCLKALEKTEDVFVLKIDQLTAENYASFRRDGEEAKAVITNHRTISILAIGVAVLLALLLGWRMSEHIGRPLSELTRTTEKIKDGDFSARAAVKNDDELGTLAHSFNSMIEELGYARILREQQAQLKSTNEQLRQKNAALDSFVYRVSHDLKSPVINISALVNLLGKKWPTPDARLQQTITFIRHSAERLQQTIYDLLEVSRLERNHDKKPELVDFQSVLDETLEQLNDSVMKSGAAFDVDFRQVSAFIFPKIDLQSILQNLISNAIKYAQRGRKPQVKIRTLVAHPFVCLLVEDNGMGMDLEKYGSKLFGMFTRFHDHVEGSGVGLYIVKRLVENAGGHIEVHSTVGVGTAFRVFLPLAPVVQEEHVFEKNELEETAALAHFSETKWLSHAKVVGQHNRVVDQKDAGIEGGKSAILVGEEG